MATNYADCYDHVMPDVPMAPTPVVLNAIRDSVIEFCQRTLIYRQELQQILVLGDTSTTTTAAVSSGATSIPVASISNFSDDDYITVELTDGTKWRGQINGTPAALTITLDGALNEDVDSGATVTKLVYLYTVTTPSGTVVAKGLDAWLNDTPLEPISIDDLNSAFNKTEFGWVGTNWRTDIGLPTMWYMPDSLTVGLILAPEAGGNLRINAALKPTKASTSFPTWIYDQYMDGIAHGAKARLQLSPKKPYSDPNLGMAHMEMFNDAITAAKIHHARGGTRASLRTRTVFGLR